MSQDEIRDVLVQVFSEIQSNSGRMIPEIQDDLCPVGDLEGFDSLNAVEATSLLSEYLDCDFEPDLILPTYPGKQLTIREIVDRIQRAISASTKGLST